jgi:dephospho-CoA kinase
VTAGIGSRGRGIDRAGRPLRIGLTGPIGCGKSTVAGWLGDAGAVVVDADQIARDVVEPGSATLGRVIAAFGPEVERPDGSLDRGALAERVFADPAELARLEAIVHPAVRRRILAALAAASAGGAEAVVVEAIRLVEGGLADLCDEVWLIRCPPGAQRARLRRRGLGDEDAERRIAAQAGLEDAARERATRVIATGGSQARTRARVAAAYADALEGWRDTGDAGGRTTES